MEDVDAAGTRARRHRPAASRRRRPGRPAPPAGGSAAARSERPDRANPCPSRDASRPTTEAAASPTDTRWRTPGRASSAAAARASSWPSGRHRRSGGSPAGWASRGRRRSPLQPELDRLVRILLVVAIALIAIVTGLGFVRGQEAGANMLAGISAAIAAIPEEPPILLAVILGLGAYRLLKRGVLVRRLNAEETLGAIDLIVTDKTGTLTRNRLDVVSVTGLAGPVEDAARLEILDGGAARRGRRLGPRRGNGAGVVHRVARPGDRGRRRRRRARPGRPGRGRARRRRPAVSRTRSRGSGRASMELAIGAPEAILRPAVPARTRSDERRLACTRIEAPGGQRGAAGRPGAPAGRRAVGGPRADRLRRSAARRDPRGARDGARRRHRGHRRHRRPPADGRRHRRRGRPRPRPGRRRRATSRPGTTPGSRRTCRTSRSSPARRPSRRSGWSGWPARPVGRWRSPATASTTPRPSTAPTSRSRWAPGRRSPRRPPTWSSATTRSRR